MASRPAPGAQDGHGAQVLAGPGSSWATDDGSYDESLFYTRASDSRGHSTWLKNRVPPYLVDQVAAVLATRAWPQYATQGDLVRDAIAHRLHWLADHADDPAQRERMAALVHRLTREQRLADYEAEIEGHESYLKRLGQVANRAMAIGDIDHLTHLVDEVRSEAQVMREPFRTKTMAAVGEIEERLRLAETNT